MTGLTPQEKTGASSVIQRLWLKNWFNNRRRYPRHVTRRRGGLLGVCSYQFAGTLPRTRPGLIVWVFGF